MTIPVPVFMPAESCEADNSVVIECVIKQNRMDERRTVADRYASRMRVLGAMAVRDKLDCYQIAELLESEACESERQIQEWNHA
ncbi:DUF2732 family protein [Morganella morganii subsp. morganii]|uniref:DUF2732 family protein n=1 Tax=Morganella morganii TaxID=582 RepID=UPI001BABA401|nr:DUF2732 family protein [Morganella morganii]ELA8471733.1 DUF2732 family protein [Morganella morganii]MBT0449171.1 DUF2732 family protein [Morganella morganii subsp. morganii]MBT0507313.1 DUF2732 family protein [Morganella morganii subsp. morganii]MDT5423200.1 DUF2732 family protein [Morganella morganii]QUI28280.1 DUF2732 family protein [Morganella morganii]